MLYTAIVEFILNHLIIRNWKKKSIDSTLLFIDYKGEVTPLHLAINWLYRV